MSKNNEIWKPVVGYEGLYEISSMGRVNSLGRWGKGTYKTLGGYIWKYYDKETYLIGIMNNNIKKGAS